MGVVESKERREERGEERGGEGREGSGMRG